MLYTLASSIGQLKWCWFQDRKHTAQDLQTFDNASRGPVGSGTLLFSKKIFSAAAVCSLITILSLAFDTFAQQALSYPTKTEPTVLDVPTTKMSRYFAESASSDAWLNALNTGAYSRASDFARDPVCSTGNCTWDEFKSIEWCSKCQDASDRITINNCNLSSVACHYSNTIPINFNDSGCVADFGYGNTQQLVAPGGSDGDAVLLSDAVWMLDLTYGQDNISNMSHLGAMNPVVSLAHLNVRLKNSTLSLHDSKNNVDCGSPILQNAGTEAFEVVTAEECIITLCERTLQVSVVNGTPRTTVVNENFGLLEQFGTGIPGHIIHGQPEPQYIDNMICWRTNDTSPVPDLDNIAAHCRNHSVPLALPASPFFCPLGVSGSSGGDGSVCGDGPSYAMSIANHLTGNQTADLEIMLAYGSSYVTYDLTYSSPISERISSSNLSVVADGVAQALTQLALSDDTAWNVNGTALVTGTYVAVAWPWLLFPTTLVFGTAILLAKVVMQSHNKGIKLWKTSVLPFLYHGYEDEPWTDNASFDHVSAMTTAAEGRQVGLKYSAARKRMMLRQL